MFIIPVLLVSDKVDDVDPAKKENMLDGLLGHLRKNSNIKPFQPILKIITYI